MTRPRADGSSFLTRSNGASGQEADSNAVTDFPISDIF
jgi:hypothetical protein